MRMETRGRVARGVFRTDTRNGDREHAPWMLSGRLAMEAGVANAEMRIVIAEGMFGFDMVELICPPTVGCRFEVRSLRKTITKPAEQCVSQRRRRSRAVGGGESATLIGTGVVTVRVHEA